EPSVEERAHAPVQRRQRAEKGVARGLHEPLLPFDLAIYRGHVAEFEVAPRFPHVPLGREPLVSRLAGEPDQLVGAREPIAHAVALSTSASARASPTRRAISIAARASESFPFGLPTKVRKPASRPITRARRALSRPSRAARARSRRATLLLIILSKPTFGP